MNTQRKIGFQNTRLPVFKTKVTKYIHLALSETKLTCSLYCIAITVVLLFKKREETPRVREGKYHHHHHHCVTCVPSTNDTGNKLSPVSITPA
jgi:hypothetical protein